MSSYDEIRKAGAERRLYTHKLPTTLVVLGAGASYNCFGQNEHELVSKKLDEVGLGLSDRWAQLTNLAKVLPPLTSQLTQSLRPHSSGCDQLLDLIDQYLRKAQRENSLFDFESTLNKIYVDSHDRFPDAFLALRHAIVKRMQLADEIGQTIPTLYTTLFSRILLNPNFADRELAVLNMNYDRLAEFALTDRNGIDSVKEFAQNDRAWSLYHPHGNCAWSISSINILRADSIPIANDDPHGDKLYGGYTNAAPALALPMYGDPNGKLILPEHHRRHLKNQLANVDQILVIGWRGADKEIVALVEDGIEISNLFNIQIVGTKPDAVESIKSKLASWGAESAITEGYHAPDAFRGYLEDENSPFAIAFPL